MIAMSTVLEKRTCFTNVLGYASMLGEDGRPMHKSWGNAIEFNEGADKIGVDVMRWMFARHDPEQNLLFGYKLADETRRKFHLLLWNIYNFFVTYATIDGWDPDKKVAASTNVLDKWILGILENVVRTVTTSLETYDPTTAAASIEAFVTDLSQWYIRRSRDRVGPVAADHKDKDQCYSTLYDVLVTLSKILAPFVPFFSEELYKNLTREDSVHLAKWPEPTAKRVSQLDSLMMEVRRICELGHAQRKAEKIKVRQPLASCVVTNASLKLDTSFLELIKDELNVKNIEVKIGKGELAITIDTTLTPELRAEGQARELMRQIQILRKEKGCTIDERVVVVAPKEYQALSGELLETVKRETLTSKLIWGEKLSILTG